MPKGPRRFNGASRSILQNLFEILPSDLWTDVCFFHFSFYYMYAHTQHLHAGTVILSMCDRVWAVKATTDTCIRVGYLRHTSRVAVLFGPCVNARCFLHQAAFIFVVLTVKLLCSKKAKNFFVFYTSYLTSWNRSK